MRQCVLGIKARGSDKSVIPRSLPQLDDWQQWSIEVENPRELTEDHDVFEDRGAHTLHRRSGRQQQVIKRKGGNNNENVFGLRKGDSR